VKLHAQVGDRILKGQSIATLHHHDTGAETAAAMLVKAFEISAGKPNQTPLIIEKL
jgi:thymidine phosphorylase